MAAANTFDTIIIGGGAMGSAAAWQLSARGRRVLVLDRFHPPHNWGSTHGETRVIREAYFEHPSYVPLVQRAYELWRDLEARTGRQLLRITGGLMIGRPDGVVFSGAKRSAELHCLPHEVLDPDGVSRRFPALRLADAMMAVFEPRAGILFVEDCVSAALELATEHGATLRFDEPVIKWRAKHSGVEVKTPKGIYSGATLIVSAGAWLPALVSELAGRLCVERQVLHWFEPADHLEWFRPDRLPVHVFEYQPGRFFYALPDVGTGVKAALHHQGESTTPENVSRDVSEAEQAAMSELVKRHLPLLRNPPHESITCLYTNTPDEHFLIDWHPVLPNVLLVSPCSGHGFKFASAIGEVVAGLVLGTQSRFDLSLFSIDRFDWRRR